MKTIQELKSEGDIKSLPVQKFHVSEIDIAFVTFTKGTYVGKLIIDYDDTSDRGLNVGLVPLI